MKLKNKERNKVNKENNWQKCKVSWENYKIEVLYYML